MAKKPYRKANNRANSIVNRHLQENSINSFECFEETVRNRRYSRWDIELEIKVEELYRAEVYEPIYEMLLKDNGVIEQWAKLFGDRYNIHWHELFSEFQLHLFNMLDGIADKSYTKEISFMNNLYKQLECVAKDKRKYLNRDKRKDDSNCVSNELLEQIPDNSHKNYDNIDILVSLEKLPLSENDRKVLMGLASGTICRNDIPVVLDWSNKDDRKKLSRYCQKLAKILKQYEIVYS